ncbi:MAG: ATP-dependent Clp protease adaptor ClpS [Miltoncostaeaceae bacterium]
MSTETPVRQPRVREPGAGSGSGDPVSIVVLNDDHNTFQGVATALSRYLPGVDYEKGMGLAGQIHANGRATVWRGDREQAELYWEQLRDAGLTMAPLQ